MPPPPGQDPTALVFHSLAEIAAGETAKVELCRVDAGPAEGRLVAVKRLHPHLATDPAFVAQFRDEMWMTAALRHPNVVEVVGWGSDDQGLYLAVELVQGVSLARLMKTIFDTGEAFTERMVVFLARQVCRGLGMAHALRAPSGELLGLVHRDLTPGNILCSFQGDVKIADFGLAKAKQRLTRTLTGMVKGQLEYISPEQATGNNIDARADVFSLGVMLFELFAARRPWVAPNDMELARRLMTEPPADLFKLRPKIDRELVNIVNKCLEKDPKKRFQSIAEILARLDEWLSAHGYMEDNEEALGRFVRRNAMRQMAWFERVIAGSAAPLPETREKQRPPTFTGAAVSVAPRNIPPPADSSPPTERPGSKRSMSPTPKTKVSGSAAVSSDITDDTTAGAGAKIASAKARTAANPPRISQAKHTGDGEVDWGEEVATLVKGDTPGELEKLRQAFRGGKPFDPKVVGEVARPEPLDEDTVPKPLRAPLSSSTMVEGRPAQAGASRLDFEDVPSEDPTAPIGDLLQKVRATQAKKGPAGSPDHAAAAPTTTRSAGSAPPPPPPGDAASGDEKLRAEAERLTIEAMRLAEEAKAAYARAEKKAALAKATSDAASIAADAVRIARASGVVEGMRRLEVALAMERSARATEGASAQAVSAPPPGLVAMAPPPIPPAALSPSVPPVAPSIPAIPPAPPVPGRSVPPPTQALQRHTPTPAGLMERQALPAPVVENDDVFATQLRPKVMGLPVPAVIAMGVGIVVVVLLVLWISFS